jgi:hypothetical protein
MLRHYYINRGWMVSIAARRVYRVATSLSLALFFVFLAMGLTEAIPDALIPVLKAVILAGVLGSATTMVAMEYFVWLRQLLCHEEGVLVLRDAASPGGPRFILLPGLLAFEAR